MALLAGALRPRADASWAPWDDRWYTPYVGLQSDSGVALSADTIHLCGTVLAAVRFLANSWAVTPPMVGKRSADGSRQADPTHYAERLLRRPNTWQTGYRWRHINMVWVSTWGNSYNRILGDGRGNFASQLLPLHPGRVKIIDQRSDGTLLYEYRPLYGGPEIIGQESMLHFRGISLDGYRGTSIYQLIRNAVGIALAAERHASVFLKKGSRLSGILSTQLPLTKDVKDRTRDSWNASFAGVNGEHAGGVAVLGDGYTFTPMAMDNQKAQYLELRDHQIREILMFFGVPGVVVGYQGDKASTFASAETFFQKGGVQHCIMPWIVNFEQEEEHALLLDDDTRFIKHNLDVLNRANTIERFDALQKACGGPFMTRNEVRDVEDMNRDPEPDMDKVLMPANMMPTGEVKGGTELDPTKATPPGLPPAPGNPAQPAEPDDKSAALARALVEARAQARQFALDAAARVVRREVAAITGRHDVASKPSSTGAAQRFASDPAGWRSWAVQYYDTHAAHVSDTLHISLEAARGYTNTQRDNLLAGGLASVDTWEASVAPRLAALALGELK